MDYPSLVLVVQDLINTTGRSIKLQQLGGTAEDADKPWRGTGVPKVIKTISTFGTFVAPTGLDKYGISFISNELLKRCDEVVLVAGAKTDYEGFHQLVDSSTTWRIEWIEKLKPGSVTLLYAIGICR